MNDKKDPKMSEIPRSLQSVNISFRSFIFILTELYLSYFVFIIPI
jgi:hypothetical protein